MRIALVAPPWFEVPPPAYGGIESLCASLAEGLVARGHEVILLGAGRDLTSARFVQTFTVPPSSRLGECLPELVHAAMVHRSLEDLEIDLVHDHTLVGALQAPGRRVPTVITVHESVAGDRGTFLRALGKTSFLVSVSQFQRDEAPDLNWAGTVNNGIPVAKYPYREHKESFVLFLGSVRPAKGAHLAIDAARAAGRPLVLAGKCSEPMERAYFENEIKPRLGPDVDWIGEVDAPTKKDLLSRARCLVFPVQSPESFGLVMAESMACGTPVVALAAGAVGEVVEDGVSGCLCAEPEGLPAAIESVDGISNAVCRQRAFDRFDIDRMIAGYERVYRAMPGGSGL